jgi:enolase
MKVIDAQVKVIKDSRNKDTLEAHLIAREGEGKNAVGVASVPAGKSTGIHEAAIIAPKLAFEKLASIKEKIVGTNFRDQHEFDSFLISLDGTENKSNLGANLILSLSLSFARAFAKSRGQELYRSIGSLLSSKIPKEGTRPVFNMVNGGIHVQVPESWNKKFGVKKGLDFQEFQVISTTSDFGISTSVGQEYYRRLGKQLVKIYGRENVLLGDEAGYLCPFKTNEEALEIMQELINRHLYPLKIGLDAAASQFYQDADARRLNTDPHRQEKDEKKNDGYYVIEGVERTPEELAMLYVDLADRYEMISIEDPFHEEAFLDFSNLHKEIPKILEITDDLTATNPLRLKKAIKEKAGNAILIKLNQIGTLSETINVVDLAYKFGWRTVVSHRSGETMDSFIADLAAGIGAWGLKAGAPGKPERQIKYKRMLEIWKRESTVF